MNVSELDHQRIALGIRQPWAELILRGEKTIEVRSSHTRQLGSIYIYASKQLADQPFAIAAIEEYQLNPAELQRGVLVGSVEITHSTPAFPRDAADACVPADFLQGRFSWHLASPHRFAEPVVPRFLPYGVWFYPFRRRKSS